MRLRVCSGLGVALMAARARAHRRRPQQPTARLPAVKDDLQKQYDAAFQEMLSKPANLDVLFSSPRLASQTGDLEGAISALERMLLINPNLPRVRLELGVLYYRLGSYEVARDLSRDGAEVAQLPAGCAGHGRAVLAQIDDQQRSRRTSAAKLFFGWRYQSNANLGPATSSVLLFGQAANLNQAAVGDGRLGRRELGAASGIRYDFGTQDKAALETQLHRLRQPPVPGLGRQRLAARPDERAALPGLQRHLRGRHAEALRHRRLRSGSTTRPTTAAGAAASKLNALLSDRLRNIIDRRVPPARQPGHQLPADQQPVPRHPNTRPTRPSSIELTPIVIAVRHRQRPALRCRHGAVAELHAVGRRRRHSRFVSPIPVLKTGLPWTISLSVSEQWWTLRCPGCRRRSQHLCGIKTIRS